MTLRRSALATALTLLSATAGTVQAQSGQTHLGPRLSYHFDVEEAGIGAQFSAPLARNLEFYPSFDYFLVSNGTFWHLNADLKYRIATESINWLYLGGGLNVARRSAGNFEDTSVGVNGFFGVESRRGRVHPFGEVRLTANDGNSSAILAVGLNFTLRQ
jgi:hypothetical protein